MRKKFGFLGFLACLSIFLFSANSFADAGYTCERTYDSCSQGYYLDGNPAQCVLCTNGCTCAGGTATPNCGYTVTYHLNNGSGTVPNPTDCAIGQTCNLASGNTTSFYRAGYVFMGWAIGNANGIPVSSITNTSINTNQDAYAIWSPCATGSWKGASANANATCTACPNDYPNTADTASTAITQCYSNEKQRASTGTHNENIPNGCSSAMFGECTPATCNYRAYADATGTADGALFDGCATNTNTCDKPVSSVIAASGYFAPANATTCTSCASINTVYPYSDPNTTDQSNCYRDCVPGTESNPDIPGSTSVTGRVTAGGTNTCAATACSINYYLKDGACLSCPPNAVCNGESATFVCNGGYEQNTAGDGCDPLTYSVTLDPNNGTCGIGCTSSVTATYATAMPALSASELPTREVPWSFSGYFDDPTNGTQYYSASGASVHTWDKTSATTLYAHWTQSMEPCQTGKYYNGTTHVDCPSGKYCPGPTVIPETLQGSAGCSIECTTLGVEYDSSDLGATTSAGCYKTCNTAACIPGTSPSGCPQTPIPANSCTFDTESSTAGRMYYGSGTCENYTNAACPYDTVKCPALAYRDLNTNQCKECPAPYDQSRGNNFQGITDCYAICELPCTKDECPINATCEYQYSSVCHTDTTIDYCISGKQYYGSNCNANGSCAMTITCNSGYEKHVDSESVSCDPGIYTITLQDSKNNTTTYIYEKYATGWYSDSEATISATGITPPTFTNWEFNGYYTDTGTTPIILPNGQINVTNTRFTADTTLYAHWTQGTFTCTLGKTGTLDPCPEGYYCPGGDVYMENKDNPDTGCHKTCPSDVVGGTVTSPTSSTMITQCQTTRTGVPLNDLGGGQSSGGGDQVCNYVDDSDQEYKNCLSVTIKYCNGGYYLTAGDAPACTPVGTGNWSPAPTSTTLDNTSMVRYACSGLPGYTNATTAGETSELPTACYNTCPSQNVLDSSDNIIGSRAPVHATEAFTGTITAYDYVNKSVTTSGTYPTCTYQAPVCNAGYHTSGTTCEPNIYTFTFNKDGGTGGDNGPIYMKYATGWYSDSAATIPVTTVTLPTQGTQNCSGYEATIGSTSVSVINASGQVVASNTLVNYADTTATTELTASWVAKQTTECAAGQYFSNTDDECKACPNGSWCPGGTAFSGPDRDGQDHFINTCPSATTATYTPAQTWNGTTLVDVAPNVGSDNGRNEESDCYATVQYSATKGKGSRVCHYGAGKYESDCNSIQILTCDSGYWLDTTQTDTNCSLVGLQYYSSVYRTDRERCPEAVYDITDPQNTISTDTNESDSVGKCVREGIWELTNYGGRIKRCHWSTVNNSYSINCGDSFAMRKCKAGYYDELNGNTTNNADLDCVPVGTGKWSPGPANWTATTDTGDASTFDNPCPGGVGAENVVSTTPTTETTTSGAITACYLACEPTITVGGTTSNVKNPNGRAYYNDTDDAYEICVYDKCPAGMWCDANGPHACPSDKDGAPGTADFDGQEFRDITSCYIMYNPWPTTFSSNYTGSRTPWGYGTGWVKAFYQGTATSGDYTNYFNVGALTCDGGYYYNAAMTCSEVDVCKYSPAQTAFPGEIPTDTIPGSSTGQIACPVGCSGSESKAGNFNQCYKACPEDASVFDATLNPDKMETIASIDTGKKVWADSATTYPACQYHITCATGYDVHNDNSATPSCDAHTYTIVLDKNGGTGTTDASIQCTFDSGSCVLPTITDMRTGYSTANKWCTAADGTGTCYNAGTTVTTNISSDATDTTLYAQWTPNVYMITLNHNGAATAGAPATVYLKYATGWYSNSTTTAAITQLTTKPVKGVMAFTGYKSDNDIFVIDADGKFKTDTAALTFTTTNTTINADWADAPIECPAGKYYAGNGDDPTNPNVCKTCPENHYCTGVTVQTNSGQAGVEPCPDTGLSPEGSSVSSACYRNLLPTYIAAHGTGTQTCYYNDTALAYSAGCINPAITACDAGYWLADPSDTDCTMAGVGYYSANLTLTRNQCPNGGTTVSTNTTAETVNECFKTGLDYSATDSSGTGTQSCWYSSGEGNSALYARDCFDKVITACRAGYYRANSTDITCTEVELNYYSGENDIEKHICPAGGATRNKKTGTVDLCYKDGLAYVAEHGGGSQTCYWSTNTSTYDIGCGDKTVTYCDGGYYLINSQSLDCVAVGYGAYSPNLDLEKHTCTDGMTTLSQTSTSATDCFTCPAGSVCAPGQGIQTCSELTSGQFTMSDIGTSNVAYCYRDCAMETNANAMSGRDYYTTDDTCVITSCEAGYALDGGQCVPCPDGYFCDGTPGEDGDGKKSCADLGDGTWVNSISGATGANACYKMCVEHTEGTCTLTPQGSTAHWPDDCQYTGTSATGNPAEVIGGVCVETSCINTYEMINGVCEPCIAQNNKAMTFKAEGNCMVESCIMGYHPNGRKCDQDVVDCTAQAPNATQAEQKWVASRGAYGICEIKSCEDDFHIASNACVANEQVCNIPNGVGTKTWNKLTNSWNPCIATSCVPGYTNIPSEKNDESEQCSSCRNRFSALGEAAASSYSSGCTIASCIYQGEKYNLDTDLNECVSICSTVPCPAGNLAAITNIPLGAPKDETGWMCWDDSAKKCRRTCSPGYVSW